MPLPIGKKLQSSLANLKASLSLKDALSQIAICICYLLTFAACLGGWHDSVKTMARPTFSTYSGHHGHLGALQCVVHTCGHVCLQSKERHPQGPSWTDPLDSGDRGRGSSMQLLPKNFLNYYLFGVKETMLLTCNRFQSAIKKALLVVASCRSNILGFDQAPASLLQLAKAQASPSCAWILHSRATSCESVELLVAEASGWRNGEIHWQKQKRVACVWCLLLCRFVSAFLCLEQAIGILIHTHFTPTFQNDVGYYGTVCTSPSHPLTFGAGAV